MRTRSAHPASRPLPFRSLQELRRHLNCCFQLIYFYHNFKPNAIPPADRFAVAPSPPIMTATYQPTEATLEAPPQLCYKKREHTTSVPAPGESRSYDDGKQSLF